MQEHYPALVGVLIAVELMGAVLFLFNSDLGAALLVCLSWCNVHVKGWVI